MTQGTRPDLSVVIPAFNEERYMGRMLATLRRNAGGLALELIVVDNGSQDRTRQIAEAGSADIVLTAQGTVAAIRNTGAARAAADVLMFMDADVFTTGAWAARIGEVLGDVRAGRIVTGSWVSVPDDCGWIEKYWFEPLEHGRNTHMNSGHMIVSTRLFGELGGFDATLRTGEDFDLSMRARALGASIVDDVRLRVIHEGYPKTLGEFMRREVWHGVGDCQSLRGFVGSRVAVLGFLVLHGQVAGWLLSLAVGTALPGIAATLGSLAISLLASVRRYRGTGWRVRGVTTALYYFYFIARGLSLYASSRRSAKRSAPVGARH